MSGPLGLQNQILKRSVQIIGSKRGHNLALKGLTKNIDKKQRW